MSEQLRLKKLQTLEAEAKNILYVVKEQQRDASRKVNQASERLKEVRNEIRQLTVENSVLVSEHAILRYFERVLGYDLEKIKSVIVPPQTQQQIEHFGGGTFPISNNNNNLPPFKIRVRNNTVVTVLTEDDSYRSS